MKRYCFAGFLILSLGLLYGFRLNFPQKIYYDEVYHVTTAREFIALSGNTDTSHPPFGKLLIAASILIFGDHSWVWRLVPLLCGSGSVALFFLLAQKLFKSEKPALFAAVLLAFDGISITQSRIAMLNTPMFLFMLLAVYFWLRALERKTQTLDFVLTGIFLGLTAATRWVGLGVTAVMGLVLLGYGPQSKSPKFFTNLLIFIVIPALIIYFSAHLILPFIKGYTWKSIFTCQKEMFRYHYTLKARHAYGSSWWGWPVLRRPIWYFFERRDGLVYGIFCIGNPAIFWTSVAAMIYLFFKAVTQRCRVSAFILAGYLSQWLPWALISRVKFFHYYYAATPFVALSLAVLFRDVWSTGKSGKLVTAVYFACVLISFIYWYPLYTGYPISEQYFQQHLWFKSWI